jgi:hypothetical protein
LTLPCVPVFSLLGVFSPACCVPCPGPGVGAGPSLPFRPKSQRLSPCGVAPSELPPEKKATNSWRPCWKTVAVSLAPAPVWKLHSFFPLVASYACSSPELRPTKTRPPEVVAVPA